MFAVGKILLADPDTDRLPFRYEAQAKIQVFENAFDALTVDVANGGVAEIYLSGNLVLSLATPDTTECVTLSIDVIQSDSGVAVVTWDGSIKWVAEGIAPVISTGPNVEDNYIFRWTPNRGWRGYVAGMNMAVP